MPSSKFEVADVFRRHGEAWRTANAGHVSLGQRRVMTAIEICRTAALGGHVERCEDCAHTRTAYNSCRNRHCPKCQWRAAERWLAARAAELLPAPYFHAVFTLPATIGAIAYQNKAKVYSLLFTAAAKTLTTIAADQKHLGAQISATPPAGERRGVPSQHGIAETSFLCDVSRMALLMCHQADVVRQAACSPRSHSSRWGARRSGVG
jgi:hypothetical protein